MRVTICCIHARCCHLLAWNFLLRFVLVRSSFVFLLNRLVRETNTNSSMTDVVSVFLFFKCSLL
jgi:hypothetical protein